LIPNLCLPIVAVRRALRETLLLRNSVMAKFAEFPFHEVR
jgi:hypothetical protein